MNKFLDDPRFKGIKPFEKKSGIKSIIGATKKKTLIFQGFSRG